MLCSREETLWKFGDLSIDGLDCGRVLIATSMLDNDVTDSSMPTTGIGEKQKVFRGVVAVAVGCMGGKEAGQCCSRVLSLFQRDATQ